MIKNPFAQAIGWTIFHSLWEGAAVALLLSVALRTMQSSRARYGGGCVAMLAILASFVITFSVVLPDASRTKAAIVRSTDASAEPLPQSHELPRPSNRAAVLLPWLTPFWIVGVMFFHLRGLASWIGACRLRHTGVCAAPDFWQRKLTQLIATTSISKSITLLESCLTEVPVVIGHLRPVILIPLGMLTGMPVHQIEAILLHELAHIRRRDYLVNLLQTLVEDFLFYHPAVWWISGTIRTERENCCDDFVVITQGNSFEYAAALATLELTRGTRNQTVLAATGGTLMKRIRRLLYPQENPRSALTPIFSVAILTITATVALMAWQTQPPVAVDPYKVWLNQDVVYIIDKEERAAFNNLTSNEERDMFIKQFWERRDPTPGTVENEVKEEHYRRIGYANSHYAPSTGLPGWKTDRGRIYITYGPADEIESHPSGGKYRPPSAETLGEQNTFPFEQWLYHSIQGVGKNVIIEFVDEPNNGEFHMTRDPAEKYKAH